MTFSETFDTIADLGWFTNEVFSGTTKNARIIRRGIHLAMKQIQAIASSSLQYKNKTTIASVNAQIYYPLPDDFVTVAFAYAIVGSQRIPLNKIAESEWASLTQVNSQSGYTQGYRTTTENGVSKIGFYPIPTAGISFEIEYQMSHRDLNYTPASPDANVVLWLEEGYEMLPVYFTLALLIKGREDAGNGNNWQNDYAQLLTQYKEAGITDSENLVVKRRHKTRRGNASLIHIIP